MEDVGTLESPPGVGVDPAGTHFFAESSCSITDAFAATIDCSLESKWIYLVKEYTRK